LNGATEQLQRLRDLSVKNLAVTVCKQHGRDREALELLGSAIENCSSDTGLVDRYATLAAKLGEWTVAKDAFTSGLALDHTHKTMKMKLMEVLGHLNDHATLLSSRMQLSSVNLASNDSNNTLLRDLPPVSRKPLPVTFDSNPNEKIVVRVVDWVDLLRQVGKVREGYRPGCTSIRVKFLEDCTERDVDYTDVQEDVEMGSRKRDLVESRGDLEGSDPSPVLPCKSPARTRQHAGDELVIPEDSPESSEGIDIALEFSRFLQDSRPGFLTEVDPLNDAEDDARSVLPDGFTTRLLSMCDGIYWSLDALSTLLVLYFSQSSDLARLQDCECRYLIALIESVDQPLPPSSTMTLAEWAVEKLSDIKETSLGGNLMEESRQIDLLWLGSTAERLLVRASLETMQSFEDWHERCSDEEYCQISSDMAVRYLFAKGKLMQAFDLNEEAKECLTDCLAVLGQMDIQLLLDHLRQDKIITEARVRFMLESVDIHSEMRKIRSQPDRSDGVKEKLASVSLTVLSGPESESFMLGVDPSGWKNIIRELIDASVKNDDMSTALRCQIRLLHALLPRADLEEAGDHPLHYLEQMVKPESMNLFLNCIQLDKTIYSLAWEDLRFDEYERNLLRDVLRRLLLVMHACHTFMSTKKLALDAKGFKQCQILLVTSSAIFLALLGLDWNESHDTDVVPVLDRLFDELGCLGLLLSRKSMIPFFALPYLGSIYSRLSSDDADGTSAKLGMLESQMIHMLKFAFDVSLSPEMDISSYCTCLNELQPRSIGSMNELITIWPFCVDILSSYGSKILKDRAGCFVDQCFEVAVSLLPLHIKSHKTMVLQKWGLQRPPGPLSVRVDSSFEAPFLPGEKGEVLHSLSPALVEVFSSVFNLKIKLNTFDMNMIGKQAEFLDLRKLDADIEPYLWNLAFNADTTDHWFAVGEFYSKTSDMMSEICFVEGRKPSNDEAQEIHQRRNIAYWCLCHAGGCADYEWASDPDKVEARREHLSRIFEFYGRSLLDESADAKSPRREDILQHAYTAFVAATRFYPIKYSHHMFVGVCGKRLGKSPREYLPILAHACKLAKEDARNITFIDPLFEIHAARMELLEALDETNTDDRTREILALCSLYPFSAVEDTAVHPGKEQGESRVRSLYSDTVDAMEWCLEMDRSYYKPCLRLASSPWIDSRTKCEQLNLLFSNKTSRQFALGMGPIREKGAHLQRSKQKRRRVDDRVSNTNIKLCTQDQAISEIRNGTKYPVKACPEARKPVAKNIGIGTDGTDSTRVHLLVSMRKALLDYVEVLGEVKQKDKLEEIREFLVSSEDECFELKEFKEVIEYCRVSCMLLCLEEATLSFPADELAALPVDYFLSTERTLHVGCDLKAVYDLYLEGLVVSQQERFFSIVAPVAKFLRWRLSARGKIHQTEELCGKMLITKKGSSLHGKYACLCALSSGPDQMIQMYQDFLDQVHSQDHRLTLLGLVFAARSPSLILASGPSDADQCINLTKTFLLHAHEIIRGIYTREDLLPVHKHIKDSVIPRLQRVIYETYLEKNNGSGSVKMQDVMAEIGLKHLYDENIGDVGIKEVSNDDNEEDDNEEDDIDEDVDDDEDVDSFDEDDNGNDSDADADNVMNDEGNIGDGHKEEYGNDKPYSAEDLGQPTDIAAMAMAAFDEAADLPMRDG
jgi:hypothetical protein